MFKNKLNFLKVAIALSALAVIIAAVIMAKVTLNNPKDSAALQNRQNSSGNGQQENGEVLSREELLAIRPDDHLWGNKDSKVKIIIYDDFECPYCAEFYDAVEQAKKEFEGKIAIIFRHSPIPNHPNAFPAALAAECAAEQGKFWEMYGKLFQDNKNNTMDVDQYKKDAADIGLDQALFDTCIGSQKYVGKIAEQKAQGSEVLGITGTPTFFINENIYPGAYPFEDKNNESRQIEGLKSMIDKALAL